MYTLRRKKKINCRDEQGLNSLSKEKTFYHLFWELILLKAYFSSASDLCLK